MNLSLLEELIETGSGPELDNLLHSNPILVQTKTSHGISPLLLACYYQKPILIRLILKHMDNLNIHEAAAVGQVEELEKILSETPSQLNSVSEQGFTPLSLATHFGQEDAVRYLLSKHADPNIFSQNGYAVFPLHIAVHQNFNNITKMLLEAEAEVNVFQSMRNTPLHFAAQNGNIELIILLLEKGSRVELKNDNGHTASDLAFERGFAEIGNILKT